MTSIADLLEWDPDALDAVVDDLIAQRRTLTDLQDELDDSAVPDSWTGEAAAAAASAHTELRHGLSDIVASVSAALTAAGDAEGSVRAARRAAEDAIDLATSQGFSVDTATGRVTENQCYDLTEDEAADRQRLCDEIVDRLEQAMRTADGADAALASALQTAGEGVDGGVGSLALASLMGNVAGDKDLLPPPEDASAADMAGWWEGLTEDERAEVVRDHPEWIGNVDGIPAAGRDAANRVLLDRYLQADQAQLDQLLDDIASGTMSESELMAAAGEVADLRERIDSMQAIDDILDKPGERQLLLLDPDSGEEFRAAMANGDVDTADHVAVFTPGFTSTVEGMGDNDDDMAQLRQRATDEAFRYGDGGSVATVTWLGYDAPQVSGVADPFGGSVASSSRAEEGGALLNDFLNGIDASRVEDPHLTALGHSYGSTTTGYALQESNGVDRAVIFGSPGLGANHVEDFDVPEGELYRVEARRDWVADFGAFGIDPSHIDDVVGLSAKDAEVDGQQLSQSTGHSAYLNDDTTSQHNMAVIVGGADADRLVLDDGRGFGDVITWMPDFMK